MRAWGTEIGGNMAKKKRRKLNTKKASVSATPWDDGAVELAKRIDPDLRECTAQEFAEWVALQSAKVVRHAPNEIRFVAELCIRDWENSLVLASNAGQPVHSAIAVFGMHETLKHARVRAGDVGHMLLAAKEGRATIRAVNGERALVCNDIPPVYPTTVAKAVQGRVEANTELWYSTPHEESNQGNCRQVTRWVNRPHIAESTLRWHYLRLNSG